MKRIIGLTTAALLSASMMAAPAFAGGNVNKTGGVNAEAGASGDRNVEAETGAGSGAATTMPGTGADIDTGTTAAITPTFDSALTAIGGAETSAQSIGTLSETPRVNVVQVGELEGADSAALETAVSENQAGVDELHTAIEGNAALSQELEAQGVDAADVVAAQVEADGAVTIYVM